MSTEEPNNSPPSKDEKENEEEKEVKGIGDSSEVQFCWHCGADISFQKKDYCEKCNAPLSEQLRAELLNRQEPTQSTKCWRCGGTTSGDVCGICGAPLTKQGFTELEQYRKIEVEQIVSETISVFSPKDRGYVPVELSFEELSEIVAKYVTIIDKANSQTTGLLYYVKRPENSNETFAKLRSDSMLTEKNLKVIIRNEKISPEVKQVALRFYYWKPETTKERYSIRSIGWNIGLFVATIVTVSIAGWQFTKSLYTEYGFEGKPALDVFLFTLSIMGILTIHELGHYSVSRLKKIDASLPYFIPIPPLPGFQTLGTFGALIRQKEPLATRDDLFDIGISGPAAGFLVTIPVFIIGLKLSYVIDIPLDTTAVDPIDIPTVLLMDALVLFGQFTRILPYFDPTVQTVAMHPMMFAGYVGMLLTGLNLMPVSQLDGGHTSRAVFGHIPHRIISMVFALLLVLNPFTRYFGLFVLLMSFTQHPGSTDDVSSVHWSKYVYIILGFIIGIICLPLPINLIISFFTPA